LGQSGCRERSGIGHQVGSAKQSSPTLRLAAGLPRPPRRLQLDVPFKTFFFKTFFNVVCRYQKLYRLVEFMG
jgi:hypothetical protein